MDTKKVAGYTKEGKELTNFSELNTAWDNKEYVYDEVQKNILLAEDGTSLKGLLDKCTICPIHNGTCNCYFKISVAGYNPDLGHKEHTIMICPLGVSGDGEDCPLNK